MNLEIVCRTRNAELIEEEDGAWYMWVDHDNDPSTPPIRVRLGQSPDGRLHVEALHIEGEPVSASQLRSIPLGRIEAHANAVLHPDGAEYVVEGQAVIPPHLFELGGRSRPDEFYAEVAAIYAGLVSHTHQPVAVIADANNVPRTTAHRWVKEARVRGMLPPGRPGKAG